MSIFIPRFLGYTIFRQTQIRARNISCRDERTNKHTHTQTHTHQWRRTFGARLEVQTYLTFRSSNVLVATKTVINSHQEGCYKTLAEFSPNWRVSFHRDLVLRTWSKLSKIICVWNRLPNSDHWIMLFVYISKLPWYLFLIGIL